MRILFLGGTGNLSAECAALLHGQGHQITLLTRGRSPVPGHYHSIHADRKHAADLEAAINGESFDVVINFIGYDLEDVQLDYALFRNRTAQYIFISSATVYQKPPPRLPITEATPLQNPWWDYARKKIACEQWLMERWSQDHFPVTIVRPSHTYSHRWIPNAVSSSTYNVAARLQAGKPVFVPDDGENPWTLTAAQDFAVGLAGLAGQRAALGQAYHITSDEVLTWNQIYAIIAAALGVREPCVLRIPTDFICQAVPHLTGNLKGDKSHPAVFDNSKIKHAVPQFHCAIPFAAGVARSVAWLRAHPGQQNLSDSVEHAIEEVVTRWQEAGNAA